MSEENENVIKILLIGDTAVGKTSMARVYCGETFQPQYVSTIGIDMISTRFYHHNGNSYKLQFWDTSGMERFQCITNSYYHGAHLIFVIFDLHREEPQFQRWFNTAKEKSQATICLIGNKLDLKEANPTYTAFPQEHPTGLPYYETSVKNKRALTNVMNHIILEYLAKRPPPQPSGIRAAADPAPQQNECCSLL